MASYYTVLTQIGQAKIANAVALGQKVNLSTLAVGDAKGVTPQPDSSMKGLISEKRRAPLNRVDIDKDNPNFIVCEQVLPPDVGGFEIREVGIFDSDGNMIAYGNFPPTYKPVLSEGTSRTQTIRIALQVSDTAAVTLKVDPSVVLATREYVDDGDKRSNDAIADLKKGLGDAAHMSHSDVELKDLKPSNHDVVDARQLVQLRDYVGELRSGAHRNVSGEGDVMSVNCLKDHHLFSTSSADFTTDADDQLRAVKGTEMPITETGTYLIIGYVRAWAGGDITGIATYWRAAFMKNGIQGVPASVGTNTNAGNRDASAPLVGVVQCQAGDVITAGFAHNQGRAWETVHLYSTVAMIKIGQ